MTYWILAGMAFLIYLFEAVFRKIGLTLIGAVDCLFVFLVFVAGFVLYYKLDFGRRFRVILYLAFIFAALYIVSFIPSLSPLRDVFFYHVFQRNDVELINWGMIAGIPLLYVALHLLGIFVNAFRRRSLLQEPQ